MRSTSLFLLTAACCTAGYAAQVFGEEAPETVERRGQLEFVATVAGPTLDAVTSIEITKDGKFVYASAWQAAAVTVFERDAKTGQLTLLQEIADADLLDGATAMRLSPDEKFGVATAFRSDTAVLFKRNEDGTLEFVDAAKQDEGDVAGLEWAIDATFSEDSRFVYVANGRTYGTLTAFEILPEGFLEFIEANEGIDECFANIRGLATRPESNLIVGAASDSGCLVVVDYDRETGSTGLNELIEDNNGEATGLDGAMAVAVSPDGQCVYVSAGRFKGDNAVSVFRFDDSDRLEFVEEFIDGDALTGFVGGNEIIVTPDGKNVYAVASRSSSLACFARDVETGKLEVLETLPNVDERLSSAAGIAISPDGRHVYVAAEGSSSISIYRRQIGQPE